MNLRVSDLHQVQIIWSDVTGMNKTCYIRESWRPGILALDDFGVGDSGARKFWLFENSGARKSWRYGILAFGTSGARKPWC